MTDREIGAIIRTKRLKMGWSQVELAKKLGVTWEMVSRYERGRSSALQKLHALAEVLEIEIGEFFGTRLLQNFKDSSSEFLTSRFLPVISFVPATLHELVQSISTSDTGTYLYDDGAAIEKFGLRLGPDSKVRIGIGSVLPKGILVCTLAIGELSEQSIVLVVRNNMVSLEQYQKDDKAILLAKVVEWIVKFP